MAADLLLLYMVTVATIGGAIIRTAAILLALSAIATVTVKFVRWVQRLTHDINQLVMFARSGDERLRRIEDELADRRQPPQTPGN